MNPDRNEDLCRSPAKPPLPHATSTKAAPTKSAATPSFSGATCEPCSVARTQLKDPAATAARSLRPPHPCKTPTSAPTRVVAGRRLPSSVIRVCTLRPAQQVPTGSPPTPPLQERKSHATQSLEISPNTPPARMATHALSTNTSTASTSAKAKTAVTEGRASTVSAFVATCNGSPQVHPVRTKAPPPTARPPEPHPGLIPAPQGYHASSTPFETVAAALDWPTSSNIHRATTVSATPPRTSPVGAPWPNAISQTMTQLGVR